MRKIPDSERKWRPPLRGHQVLHLHSVRLGLHAAWLPGSLLQVGHGGTPPHLRHPELIGRGFIFQGTFAWLVFGAMFLGFAVKVPMWPFHTWLPDAHTAAPTVGSVLLAAILLKLGSYAFIRIAIPILPETAREWAPFIAVLAVIGIIYGSLACLAQTDLKRLIAFSSVGHMGFVMLGIATLTEVGSTPPSSGWWRTG